MNEPLFLPNLPQLGVIFGRLRLGHHLSEADGDLHVELRQHREDYRQLFDQLGLELIEHRRGFYYFQGEDQAASNTIQKMAVFVLILIECLGDDGLDIEHTVLTEQFSLARLPHLHKERHRLLLADLGVKDADGLRSIIQSMSTRGLARWESKDSTFVFLTPVFRILDLCIEAAQTPGAASSEDQS